MRRKRILLMEMGSFKVIGGAAKDTHMLYKSLSKDYDIDVLADYSKIDPKVKTISVSDAMSNDYDVVWMNSIRDVPTADKYRRAHRNSKTKYMYVDRGGVIHNFEGIGIGILRPKMFARRLLASRLAGWLDCYIAISVEQIPSAAAFFSKRTRIVCIPIAPHPQFRVMKIRKTFNGGITVGRLDERQKKISFMIKGIDRLKTRHPEIGDKKVLKIVGTGIDEERYKDMTRTLGLSKNISFEGFQTGDALIRQYNNSGFFVSTSLWESFGRSLLEAMACGLPALINTDINTVVSLKPRKTLVRDWYNGFAYSACNIDDFADKFYRLYSDTKTRQGMSKNALSFIRQFSFSRVVGDYEKLIDRM